MKRLFFILFLLMSCGRDKIYDKQLENNKINVDWYHYSYISSGSPDYVVVRKDKKEQLIFENSETLQDIELLNDTIILLHLEFQIKPKIKKDSVFGYIIKYKQVTSHEMYLKYLAEKNKNK